MSSILPKDSLILVSGANGLIGSHIIDQLLLLGYRVRGTVRAPEKQAWLQDFFDSRYSKGRFELVKVGDFTKPGCFEEAVKGCSGFAHVASDLSFSPDPNDIIPPVIESVKRALEAATKEDGMKTFVYTSSSTAATRPYPNQKFHISKDTWNTADVEAAWAPPPYEKPRAWAVYGASKTQGEQEMWKWAEENKPKFSVNAVLPNANFGEILVPEHQGGSTAAWIKGMVTGDFDKFKAVPPQWYVSPKDSGRLHAGALTDPSINKERIFAFAETYTWNRILGIARKLRPDLDVPEDIQDDSQDLSTVDNASALKILKERFGRDGWVPLEEALKENLKAVPTKSV